MIDDADLSFMLLDIDKSLYKFIDKLSINDSVGFSFMLLNDRLTFKNDMGMSIAVSNMFPYLCEIVIFNENNEWCSIYHGEDGSPLVLSDISSLNEYVLEVSSG